MPTSARTLATQAAAARKPAADELGQLPEWDLSDLYRGRDDPSLAT